MKSSIGKLIIVLAASMLLLTGCGEQLVKLTSSEQEAIASYAAHVIAEFNVHQRKGYTPLSRSEIKKYQQENAGTKNPEKEATNTAEEQNETSGTEQNSGAQTEQKGETGTLKQAFGLEGMAVEYKGFEVRRRYTESEAFQLDAKEGYKLLILHINIKNNGEKAAECDLLSQNPEIVVTVNGEYRAAAMTTILLNDLKSYAETIKAGATARTVLVFELSDEALKGVSSLSLNVKLGERQTNIELK